MSSRTPMGITAWLLLIVLLGAAASAIDNAISTVGHADAISEVAP